MPARMRTNALSAARPNRHVAGAPLSYTKTHLPLHRAQKCGLVKSQSRLGLPLGAIPPTRTNSPATSGSARRHLLIGSSVFGVG